MRNKLFDSLGQILVVGIAFLLAPLIASAQNYKIATMAIPNFVSANSTNTYSDGGSTNVITLKGFDQVAIEIRMRYHTNGTVGTSPVFRFAPSLFANSNACTQANLQYVIVVPVLTGTNYSVAVTNIPRNNIGAFGYLHLKSAENLSPDGVLTNFTIRWSLKTRVSGPENL